MSELNFRIIFVPASPYSADEKGKLLLDVGKCMRTCGLEVASIDFFEVVRSEVDAESEIEELTIQVLAKTGNSYPKQQKYAQYRLFSTRWNEHSKSLPCSYIVLYSNDSFISSRCSKTQITCADAMCFGVLPHDGKFYQYALLCRSDDILNEIVLHNNVNFYHDTRNVVINHDNFELSFTYAHIRNVFVSIHKSVYVYFDLFNPPIIQRVENRYSQKGNFTLKHRNLMKEEVDTDILGRANILRLCFYDWTYNLERIIANIHYECGEKPILFSRFTCLGDFPPIDPQIDGMDFGSLYVLTAIFKRNFVLMKQSSNVANDLTKLIGFSQTNPEALENALIDVLTAVDSGKILNIWHSIESRYHHYVAKKNSVDFKECIVPSKCCMTRRIILTPTRQLLSPPEILFGNRVLRNFDSDFAIRVSFRDDNILKLSFCAMFADRGFLESVVNKPMENGLYIGTRHYEFLAWSNSQIRDHGVWMYARDSQGTTAADIREWMGDFSHIHNVPKYMARMGQCFSQTEDTLSVPLYPWAVQTVPDVEGGHNPVNSKPYCFSDGVGRISKRLASKVHEALGHDKLCSAFQIRYGGYKGMLVIDPKLWDVQIEFRNSMKKFDCPNSTRLEIARTSGPVPLQLNRPFIAILNDLGVRHRVFLRLQETMLKSITDMLFDEVEAARCMRFKTPSGIYDYKDMSKSGIHLTTEPYFKNILLSLHRHQIEYLKLKANVSINPKYGRNMLGVLDETGILKYGEVFIQYTTDVSYGETTNETKILEGDVLVTKNPCHYPGDVRKFKAVAVWSLKHIVDCIVFPRRGHRPHPSEMAGSDLDGDEYSVVWLKDLIFYRPNEPAAHFPDGKTPDVSDIKVCDMINWLHEYIKRDIVGSISHAHLAHADKHGIDSNICKAVAQKISIALDFAKTGYCTPLEKNERPTEFPDFMEKNFRTEYKSQKALGKMYRICRDYETENRETAITYHTVTMDPDLIYPGWEKYKESAEEGRNKYNSVFCSLLRNYGIEHESEVFSGAFSKLHCRFQERKDRMEVQKVIIVCVKQLMKDTLGDFLEEFSSCGDVAAADTAMLQKASAWYVVTYSDPNAKYLSFPWTISKYLANIKIRRTLGKPPPFSPAILKMDEKILECERENLLPVYSGTWRGYEVLCEPMIMERALRVLILWAQDEEIIERPGHREGLLYAHVFIRLVFFVAEQQGYMCRGDEYVQEINESDSYSAGKFCIEFLKFCSTFRFYTKEELKQILPFDVYKYSRLAKRAVVSYHRFALSGQFKNLYFDRKIEDDLIDMKSFPIDSKIFQQTPISDVVLRKAEEVLKKYSNVEQVGLNEYLLTKKVWVRALGSERAIKELKCILRKKPQFLSELFKTGVMPSTEVTSQNSINVKRPIEEIGTCSTAPKVLRVLP